MKNKTFIKKWITDRYRARVMSANDGFYFISKGGTMYYMNGMTNLLYNNFGYDKRLLKSILREICYG